MEKKNVWDKEYQTSFLDEYLFLKNKVLDMNGYIKMRMESQCGNIKRRKNYG